MTGQPAPPAIDAAARAALDGLADIVTPPPVSWMPHTWGWAVVAAGLVALLIALAWRWRRHALANRYRSEALRVVAAIEARLHDQTHRHGALDEIAAVIKRTAMAAYSRGQVARLSGAEWTAFLDGQGLTDPSVRTLLDDVEYRRDADRAAISDADVRALIAATRAWIKEHRVPA